MSHPPSEYRPSGHRVSEYRPSGHRVSEYRPSEEEAISTLMERLTHRYAKNDIRDIYRIIHLLLDVLTEDEHYNHHYNKHHIIMSCLYRFYAGYPHYRDIIHSYSAYVSERLHELRHVEYEKKHEHRRTSSFCRYCVIS